jgi:branched-subunit amino acid aminotransferase/4-amino-4-deoxychorismate lyase
VNDSCYIFNGKISDSFSISPNSSSHLFGASVFTSLRSVNGCFFNIKKHFERIVLGVKYYWPWVDFDNILHGFELNVEEAQKVARNFDCYLRISCWIDMDEPTILMRSGKFKLLFRLKKIEGNFLNFGVKLKTTRIKRESLLPPYIKGGNLLAANQNLKEIGAEGFDDLLFIGQNEAVSECTTSNIFFYKNGIFFTPASSSEVLEGIIRDSFIKYQEKIESVRVGRFTIENFIDADGVFITNSVRGISIVNSINSVTFNSVQELEQVVSSFISSLE